MLSCIVSFKVTLIIWDGRLLNLILLGMGTKLVLESVWGQYGPHITVQKVAHMQPIWAPSICPCGQPTWGGHGARGQNVMGPMWVAQVGPMYLPTWAPCLADLGMLAGYIPSQLMLSSVSWSLNAVVTADTGISTHQTGRQNDCYVTELRIFF